MGELVNNYKFVQVLLTAKVRSGGEWVLGEHQGTPKHHPHPHHCFQAQQPPSGLLYPSPGVCCPKSGAESNAAVTACLLFPGGQIQWLVKQIAPEEEPPANASLCCASSLPKHGPEAPGGVCTPKSSFWWWPAPGRCSTMATGSWGCVVGAMSSSTRAVGATEV